MVTVPRKTSNEIAVSPSSRQLQNISTGENTFGQVNAQQTINASNKLGQAAQKLDLIAQDVQRREDETKLLEYETRLSEYENETLYIGDNAILNTKGSGAFGSTKSSLDGFNKFTEDLDKTLTSERQRFAATKLKSRAKNGMARTVSRHESSQRRVWESATRAAALENANDTALLNYSDPDKRNEALERVERIIRGNSQGLPSEAVNQSVEAAKTKVHTGIIERYSVDDFEGAKKYYKENKDQIDPDQQLGIEKGFKVIEKQKHAETKSAISEQMTLLRDSYAVTGEFDEAGATALEKIARDNDMDKQADSIEIMRSTVEKNKDFLDTPLPQQGDAIETLRQKVIANPTRKNVTQLETLQSSYQAKINALNGPDPSEYYEQRKEIRPYLPTNFNDPTSLSLEIHQRRLSASQVAEKDGVNIPLLKPSEMKAITQAYSQASGDGKTKLLSNIQSAFHADEAREIAKRIAPDQSNMAAVLSIVHEAPVVAEKIAAGSTRDKFVGRAVIAAKLQEDLEGAIPDGASMAPITDSIHDLYTELAFQKNDTSKELDPHRLSEATEMIVGKKMKVKTGFFDGTPSHILPFRKENGQFISESQFERVLDIIDLELLQKTHGDIFRTQSGEPLDVQETIGRSRLTTIGDGKYILQTGSGSTIVGSDPTQPFVLDMKSVTNSDNIKGIFQNLTDGLSRGTLDDYVDATRNLQHLEDIGGTSQEIEAAKKEIRTIQKRSEYRAFDRRKSSIRAGF